MSEMSNQMYEKIQEQIQTLIDKLSDQQNEGRLTEDISAAMANLTKLNDQIQSELENLKTFSEWKRFTIAFYGETNAGKSTLIEALRLLLNEPTKREEQRRFKEYQATSGLTQEAFDGVRRTILDLEDSISGIEGELGRLKQKFAESEMQVKIEIDHLTALIQETKANRTFWQKILGWFSRLPEEKMLLQTEQQLADLDKAQAAEQKALDVRLQSLEKQKQQAEQEKSRLDNEAATLAKFADGKIIGDGRSDFTRENTAFDFELNGQEFSLIDVPGIEGNEEIVKKPIEEAVSKAHAVFYVTRTARPPQTHDGEQGKKGTLEKIKEHLGAQTEVWSIYNHPVNNPRQLTSPLLNEDSQNSLAAMDEKLKTELKEQYCQSITISARPAYLALTQCVVPGSKETGEQRKFLEKFGNPQTVLSLSGLTDFVARLQTTIVGDYKNKIRRSNLNKAYKVLENSLVSLGQLQTAFMQTEKEVRSEVDNAKSQINVAIEEFTGSLNAASSKIRQNFQKQVQESIYEAIKNDLSNDEFKGRLKKELQINAEKVSVIFKDTIEKETDVFSERVHKIIERSIYHLKDIVNTQNNNFAFRKEFTMDIKIDNGLNIFGLLASGVGGVLGIVTIATGGTALVIIGGVLAVLGSVIGMAKSVWGFFNSDYKKSQQRKETDKALREVSKTIEKEIKKVIEQIEQGMTTEMDKVKTELQKPVKQCRSINNLLNQANDSLSNLARNIHL